MPPRTDRTGPDPGDVQAQAEERFADLQAQIDLPPPPSERNINYDVHVGYAPNRPHARLEDQLGAFTQGALSFEALAASLPEGSGNQIEQDASGDWVRYVPKVIGQVRDEGGAVYNQVEDEPRYVALTQAQARAASAIGRETDWWNGYTWFRRGYKPEKDLLVAAAAPQNRRVRLERADDATQALMDRNALLRAAAAPVIPHATADEMQSASARKEK